MPSSIWLVINKGEHLGNSLPEVDCRLLLSNKPLNLDRSMPHTILCNNVTDPVYAHDTLSFQWVTEKGDSFMQDNKTSTLMKPDLHAPSSNPEIWAQSQNFCMEFSQDFEGRGLGKKGTTEAPNQSNLQKVIGFFARFVKGQWTLPEYVLTCSILLAVFLLSYVLAQVMRPLPTDRLSEERWQDILTNRDEPKLQLRALKLLKPEPLKKLEDVARAKLQRDAKAYAVALVQLERSRSQFPPEALPSRVLSVSVALHLLSAKGLDGKGDWSKLLAGLGKDRFKALPILAYEEAKLRTKILELTSNASLMNFITNDLRQVTLSEQFWGAKISKAGFERARKLYEESSKSINRLLKLSDLKGSDDQFAKSYLLSRFVAQFISLSWLVDSKSQKIYIISVLNQLEKDTAFLAERDRILILQLIKERRLEIVKTNSSQDLLKSRFEFFASLEKDQQLFCDLKQSGVAPFFVIQTLSWSLEQGFIFPKTGPWERCFLGAQHYFPTQESAFDEIGPENVFLYFPFGDVQWNVGRLKGALSRIPLKPAADVNTHLWLSVLELNRIGSFVGLPQLEKRLCNKVKDSDLCSQIAFWNKTKAQDRMAHLRTHQDQIDTSSLSHLSFMIASDSITQKLSGTNRKEALSSFEKLGFGQYFGESYSEFGLLEWYLKNLP